jgi:hypothetical protein
MIRNYNYPCCLEIFFEGGIATGTEGTIDQSMQAVTAPSAFSGLAYNDPTQNLNPTSKAAMRGVPRTTESTPTTAPRPRPPTTYCLFSIFLT